MLAVQATGRVVRDRLGLELYLTRVVPLSAADTWKWLTGTTKTRRWAGAMSVIESIDQNRLTVDADGSRATFSLVEVSDGTRVFLSQRLATARDAGTAGPLWEYRLDALVAAATGSPKPAEADYATQRPYYERLAMDGEPNSWPVR